MKKSAFKKHDKLLLVLIIGFIVALLSWFVKGGTYSNGEFVELDYIRAGILLQGNFTSLFGKYGRQADKTLKFLLKNHLISFLGSDCHHEVKYNEEKLRKMLMKITKDEDYVEDILNNNFDKVINDQDMSIIRL